jgi:hypothetical protein
VTEYIIILEEEGPNIFSLSFLSRKNNGEAGRTEKGVERERERERGLRKLTRTEGLTFTFSIPM